MTSREYAVELRKAADFLDSRPEFECDARPYLGQRFYDKAKFLQAVRALGSGRKVIETSSYPDVKFLPHGNEDVRVSISRDKVCRKVADAVYECDPFLSQEELESIGA